MAETDRAPADKPAETAARHHPPAGRPAGRFGQGGGVPMVSFPRRPFFRRKKSCPFSGANAPKIDYKDTKLMQRFLSERGKIVPSRITAVSAKKQRELARAMLDTALRHHRLLVPAQDGAAGTEQGRFPNAAQQLAVRIGGSVGRGRRCVGHGESLSAGRPRR